MAGSKPNAGAGMFAEMRRQVRRVPRGKVATYGDIAYAAGFPGAARQVAWALHAESGGLPWHRIVGAGGAILLGGEQGMEQRLRLRAEGVEFRGLKVQMATCRYAAIPRRCSPGGKVRKPANPISTANSSRKTAKSTGKA